MGSGSGEARRSGLGGSRQQHSFPAMVQFSRMTTAAAAAGAAVTAATATGHDRGDGAGGERARGDNEGVKDDEMAMLEPISTGWAWLLHSRRRDGDDDDATMTTATATAATTTATQRATCDPRPLYHAISSRTGREASVVLSDWRGMSLHQGLTN